MLIAAPPLLAAGLGAGLSTSLPALSNCFLQAGRGRQAGAGVAAGVVGEWVGFGGRGAVLPATAESKHHHRLTRAPGGSNRACTASSGKQMKESRKMERKSGGMRSSSGRQGKARQGKARQKREGERRGVAHLKGMKSMPIMKGCSASGTRTPSGVW